MTKSLNAKLNAKHKAEYAEGFIAFHTNSYIRNASISQEMGFVAACFAAEKRREPIAYVQGEYARLNPKSKILQNPYSSKSDEANDCHDSIYWEQGFAGTPFKSFKALKMKTKATSRINEEI